MSDLARLALKAVRTWRKEPLDADTCDLMMELEEVAKAALRAKPTGVRSH